ncbi:hypothetical protein UCDDS831_g07655 [Diplodia seriata]|uniref:Cell wall protein n=1 Tax=Diplodia seriata TaxID=420778 RepID=A0A0G2DX10_9PEZI|nr:hypothetical protein UCDDS831_g07655 [Diplodia seriata]
MHFLAKLAVSLPAIAGVASAAVLPRAVDSDTMISALKDLAQRSSDTGDLAKALGPADQNPTTDNYVAAVNGLRDLITATGADVTAAAETQPYADDAAQQAVCDAYKTFVTFQSEMLNNFIGKSYIADGGFGAPFAAAFRSLEGADDTLSFEIIDAVPSCADSVTENKNLLDDKLSKATCAYSPGDIC